MRVKSPIAYFESALGSVFAFTQKRCYKLGEQDVFGLLERVDQDEFVCLPTTLEDLIPTSAIFPYWHNAPISVPTYKGVFYLPGISKTFDPKTAPVIDLLALFERLPLKHRLALKPEGTIYA